MKPIEEPVRWLDLRSDAPDETRALLSRARDALGPSHEELTRLGTFAAGVGTAGALGGVAGAGKVAAVRAGRHLVTKAAALKLGAILAVAGMGAGVGYSVLRTTREAPPAVATAAADVVPAASASAAPPALLAPAASIAEAPVSVPGAMHDDPTASAVAPLAVNAPGRTTTPFATTGTPTGRTATMFAPPATSTAPAAIAGSPLSPAPLGESELALLDRARARVATDPAAAMRALDEHRARYPGGTFAQEREVLAIEALVRMGRRPEAKARADAFARAFPTSAHRRRIAVLLGESAGE